MITSKHTQIVKKKSKCGPHQIVIYAGHVAEIAGDALYQSIYTSSSAKHTVCQTEVAQQLSCHVK